MRGRRGDGYEDYGYYECFDEPGKKMPWTPAMVFWGIAVIFIVMAWWTWS